jgi:serine/threonine protein kinase
MVMEYVEGTTMYQYSHEHHPIPSEILKRWAAQLTATVMALHLNSIVFIDISPNNIMITNDGQNIKLIDFGLAVDSRIIIPGHNDKLNGTPYYTSPENAESYLLGRIYANYARPSSDWYSMGMVLFDAATQRVLFNYDAVSKVAEKNRALSLWKLFGYIRNGYQMIDSDREGREDLMDFIAAITDVNPRKRLGTTGETYQEILDHPLFAGFDTLQKFIGVD